MDSTKIGQFIRQERTKKGYTQGELAELLQVSHQAVSRWEKGDNLPDVEKLYELSRLFSISIDEILAHGLDNPKPEVTQVDSSGYYFMMHAIISTVSILMFYVLFFTGILWLPFLVVFLTIIASSMLFAIPYGQKYTKTKEDFKYVKHGTMISVGVVTWIMHMYLYSFDYYIQFWESVVFWIIIELFILSLLYLVLTAFENKTFGNQETVLSTLNKLIISLLIGIFLIIVVGLLGMAFEEQFNWSERGNLIAFTAIIYMYSIFYIVMGIKLLINKFDLLTLNLLLLFLFACIQLQTITFWAISATTKIIPLQQIRLVEDAYHDMYIWFFGLMGINIIIAIVKYVEQPRFFLKQLKIYIFILSVVLLQEFTLYLGIPWFNYVTSMNYYRIEFVFGPNLLFIMILIGFAFYVALQHNPFKANKNDIV